MKHQKLFTIILASSLAFSLIACGGAENAQTSAEPESTAEVADSTSEDASMSSDESAPAAESDDSEQSTAAEQEEDADDAAESDSEQESAEEALPEEEQESVPEEPAFTGEKFKVGVYLPYTNYYDEYVADAENGIRLAVNQINAAGGLNHQEVEIVCCDTAADEEETIRAVEQLLQEENVNAVIGSIRPTETLAALSTLNESQIYNITLSYSSASLGDAGMEYTFRAVARDLTNRLAADFSAIKKLNYSNVAVILHSFNDTDTKEIIEEKAQEMGLTITALEEGDFEDPNYSSQVESVLSSEPDTIYVKTSGEMLMRVVKELRDAGYTGTILSGERFGESYIAEEEGGVGFENANYIYFTEPYVIYTDENECDLPKVKDFIEEYKAEYGELPPFDTAFTGYEAMMVLWEAAKAAGKNDSDSLRDATNQLVFEGLYGTVDFTDGSRDGYHDWESIIIADGKYMSLGNWMNNGGYEAYKESTGRDR